MDGIIIINKPKEFTSHDVVAKVKKILSLKKVGHTGTLDPNATGVLPLLINDGTKLSKYLIDHDKEYKVTLKLGIKTDTADGEGKVLEKQKVDIEKLTIEKIKKELESFKGKQEQIPPMYSAIKVNGKKLYEYARSGKKVEIEPRKIEIYNIEFSKVNKEKEEIEFKVKCSKGTYIRSLCEDIANKLGSIGYMKELERVNVGKFNILQSIKLEELEKEKNNTNYIKKHIITIEDFFKEKEIIELNNEQFIKYLNGVKLKIQKKDEIYNIYNNGKYIGIGIIKNNLLKREIVLNSGCLQ